MAIRYFFDGFRLLTKPGVRLYLIAPLLIDTVLFVVLTGFVFQQFDQAVDWLMGFLPQWLAFLSWIIWLLFGVLMLIVYGYTFTMIGTLIAAPFFGVLSERVQEYLSAPGESEALSWREYGAIAMRSLRRELRKLRYFLPRLLGILILCAVLSFVPLLNLITPIISFFWGAWNLYLQYVDYPADNNGISFDDLLADSQKRRGDAFGFGGAVLVGSAIPLLNLLVMPAAVAGATALFIDQQGLNQQGLNQQEPGQKGLDKKGSAEES